jgi:hypothetical protein
VRREETALLLFRHLAASSSPTDPSPREFQNGHADDENARIRLRRGRQPRPVKALNLPLDPPVAPLLGDRLCPDRRH